MILPIILIHNSFQLSARFRYSLCPDFYIFEFIFIDYNAVFVKSCFFLPLFQIPCYQDIAPFFSTTFIITKFGATFSAEKIIVAYIIRHILSIGLNYMEIIFTVTVNNRIAHYDIMA